jgi:hypothetical protein
VTTGPILLTGLAVCATCNGGMTLRTGTSKTGAVHRYYACSTCARKGKTVCKGRSIPMAKLDTLVTTHMNERLFQPERLAMILSSLALRRSEKADAVNARVTTLQREVTDADDKLKRLYRLVEDGMTEIDDVLKDRLNSLKTDRDRAKAALERVRFIWWSPMIWAASSAFRSCFGVPAGLEAQGPDGTKRPDAVRHPNMFASPPSSRCSRAY